MVSLFDISTQKPLWNHFSTGVPSLDSTLTLQNDAIIDIQSVPANSACSAILCSILVAHLLSGPDSTVVILETINPFPWSVLKQHPSFEQSWIDSKRVAVYALPTFAQLYAFFAFPPLPRTDPGSVLLFVTSFHETIDYYRLQMAAMHEEALLKHQIEKNRCFLDNLPKITEEGLRNVELPNPPTISRENPYSKTQAHVNGLISKISEFSFQNSAVVLFVGHLDSRSKMPPRNEHSPPSSADTSFRTPENGVSQNSNVSQNLNREIFKKSRQFLVPVTFGPANADRASLAEGKLTFRVLLYNDWFQKSPYFRHMGSRAEIKRRFHISVAKVYSLNGLKNINEPVYFHYGNTSFISKNSEINRTKKWLIDLSEPDPEANSQSAGGSDTLASLIQSSITSTQLPNRDTTMSLSAFEKAHFREFPRKKARPISISSSPPVLLNLAQNTNLEYSGDESESNDINEVSVSEGEDSEEFESAAERASEDENGSDSDGDGEREGDEMDDFEKKSEKEGSVEKNISAQIDVQSDDSEFRIVSDDASVIEGSDVESTGTIFEDLDGDNQPNWMLRHS